MYRGERAKRGVGLDGSSRFGVVGGGGGGVAETAGKPTMQRRLATETVSNRQHFLLGLQSATKGPPIIPATCPTRNRPFEITKCAHGRPVGMASYDIYMSIIVPFISPSCLWAGERMDC